jgi:hypothetical protein
MVTRPVLGGTATLGYDAESRLVSVSGPLLSATFVCDADSDQGIHDQAAMASPPVGEQRAAPLRAKMDLPFRPNVQPGSLGAIVRSYKSVVKTCPFARLMPIGQRYLPPSIK